MWFLSKLLISGAIIAFASGLAARRPFLAGLVISLPIVSALGILFAHLEHRDMERTHQFAVSILAAIPISLLFFLPFVLHKWVKLNFAWSYAAGVALAAAGYALRVWTSKAP